MAKRAAILTVPDVIVISKIYMIRGQKVMIDRDLASLYRVETKHMKRQVKRNIERFPPDFMFEMSKVEFDACMRLIFQTADSATTFNP